MPWAQPVIHVTQLLRPTNTMPSRRQKASGKFTPWLNQLSTFCRTALPLVGVEPRFWEDCFNNFSRGFQWTKWICTQSFWDYIPTYEGCLLYVFKHGCTHLEPQLRPQVAKPSCWLPRPMGGVSKSCFAMWAPQVIGKLSYECANMLDYNGSIYNQFGL